MKTEWTDDGTVKIDGTEFQLFGELVMNDKNETKQVTEEEQQDERMRQQLREVIFDVIVTDEDNELAVDVIMNGFQEEYLTPESRGLIVCPFCDGAGGGTTDDPDAMVPAYVNACYVCEGGHYLNAGRFMRAMVDRSGDWEAAVEASKLNEEEGMWV